MIALPSTVLNAADPVAMCATIDVGREIAGRSDAMILGLARNLGSRINQTEQVLKSIMPLFNTCTVFIYENDSTDDTVARLNNLASRDKRVTIQSEQRGDQKWPSVRSGARGTQMASYRNICRHAFLGSAAQYAIVVDLDIMAVETEGILHTLGKPDWDAVGSNGLHFLNGRWTQYDAWAWRDLGRHVAHHHTEINRRVYRRGDPMLPVKSCFGGMAIYQRAALQDAVYVGGDCEHVGLHTAMAVAGHNRIFCNPTQIVRYS